MTKVAREIAKDLLDIEAVSLDPSESFTWTDDIRSPTYCDSRITVGCPIVRKEVAEGLAAKIKETFPEIEMIAGAATAGVPHAAQVADILGLSMVYIRNEAKDHGKGNQIKGRISEGQRMVVIEDLISTGSSMLETVEAAECEGAAVLGIVAIFAYELSKGTANFADKQMMLLTLTSYLTLIDAALEANYIGEKDIVLLQEWKKDPEDQGK